MFWGFKTPSVWAIERKKAAKPQIHVIFLSEVVLT